MKTLYTISALLLSLVTFIGCDNDSPGYYPGEGTFIDQGFIPVPVKSTVLESEFQAAIYHNNFVFVATNDGLWKNDLTTKEWSRAGFEGKAITCIFKHPTIANKFFAGARSDGTDTDKTLHISTDGGETWNAVEEPIFEAELGAYENYVCLAVRPDHEDHLYANLDGGATIAISTDGGQHWSRMNNMPHSYFGYQSNIVFLPGNPSQLFQGSENPLDDAWLGVYDIDPSDPVILSNFTKIIDSETWENRRPNELQTYASVPNTIYIGQEGALTKVEDGTIRYIFKSVNNNFPYSYIYGIWVNPNNYKHILFGGAVNDSEQVLSLYETYDEGKTIRRLKNKLGLTNPEVMEIIPTDIHQVAILLNDRDANQVKLVLYRPFHSIFR